MNSDIINPNTDTLNNFVHNEILKDIQSEKEIEIENREEQYIITKNSFDENKSSDIDLTASIKKKISNINNSIDIIRDEAFQIQLYNNMLSEFITKNNEILNNEFSEIKKKIDKSIEIINSKIYFMEINKFKKIIKTNSGKIFETISHQCVDAEQTLKNIIPNDKSDFDNANLEQDEYNKDNEHNCKNYKNYENCKTNSKENLTKYFSLNIDEYLNYSSDSESDSESYSPAYSYTYNQNDDYLDNINFDPDICKNKKELSLLAMQIFNKTIDLESIFINSVDLKKFIDQVSLYYHDNPYHNFKHAISVLHFTSVLLTETNAIEFLSKYEIFAIMISSLVHDIDHPGNTNTFEINNKSHLAFKYNDNSVLENHHCSLAFFIIHSNEIQLLKNLNHMQFTVIRERIINCIMATDMIFHNDLINKFENKFYSGWNWNNLNDRILFSKIIVHVSDLSNQVKPFDILMKSAKSLRKEFELQIEKEKILNLPSADYMKVCDDKTFYKNELFFSSNVIKPMWNILVNLFPQLKKYHEQLDSNIAEWNKLLNLEI